MGSNAVMRESRCRCACFFDVASTNRTNVPFATPRLKVGIHKYPMHGTGGGNIMKTKRFATFSLAALLTAGTFASAAIAQGPPPPPPPPGYGYAWDAPPREFRALEQQGFRDGIYGAQKDFENHRRPTPNNRDEYRRPPVARRDMNAYRFGFERGYRVGWDHIVHGGPGNGFYGR